MTGLETDLKARRRAVGVRTEHLLALLVLSRPLNCTLMGLAVLIGCLIALGGNFQNLPLLPVSLGFITGFSLTGSSMAINDYFDRFIDAINEPGRPIPSGAVKTKCALGIAAFLGIVGLFSAGITGLEVKLGAWVLLLAIFSYALSIYYNTRGKRQGFPGNLMVSGCVAVPFIYGALVVDVKPPPLLLLFASMAFLSNTGREITKGMADFLGDKLQNVRTLASDSLEKASRIAAVFYMLSVGFSLIPICFHMVSAWYIPFVAIAGGGFLCTAFSIVKSPSPENAKKLKKLCLVWMGFGLLAFVVGTF